MMATLPGCRFPGAARALGLCALLLGFALALPRFAGAQGAGDDVTFTKQPLFRIPFQTDPNERTRLQTVWLYVSNDQGKTWHPSSKVAPAEAAFMFNAPKDGLYWFTVRTVDVDNRAFPVSMEGAKPGLKVIVDSTPPAITLRSLPIREGQVGVDWDIQEDNPELASFTLEARAQGVAEWTPIRPEPSITGNHYWRPASAGTYEVQLRLRDRAGNDGLGRTTVQTGPEARFVSENATAPPGTAVRMVNSKRFTLNYEITEVGKSGISAAELWSTPDGRFWQKHSEQKKSDGKEVRPPYEVNVEKEGLYGFTLLIRSGVGLSLQAPQAGDPPQVWVEVDLTPPVVRVTKVDVGRGPQAGSLAINWSATDKNLGRQPITLSYAEKPDGTWNPIIANRENTGSYIWRMPPDVPSQVYLKVEATDRAGNVGSAETSKPIIVDLVLPKVEIKDIAPNK
jgi:hypothetical protein